MKNSILNHFIAHFENPQIYVKSPGRVNIIGEHTDYNHGLSLPFAIEQSIEMVIGENNVGVLRMYAIDLNEYVEINLQNIQFENKGWSRYFNNALVALNRNFPKGIDVAFGGNLPQGGGVSSSSAITCGFLAGINLLLELNLLEDMLIDLASQAENGIGLQGGILDQTTIFKGKKNRTIKIDFLDASSTYFDMPPAAEYSFYLFNSGQKHDLVNTAYNDRRSTCEKALARIAKQNSSVATFRDVTLSIIDECLEDPIEIKRSIHVVEENKRVEKAAEVLVNKAYEKLGPLMNDSHASLSKNYEVSTPEIDFFVRRCQLEPKILGSRIMGGGFGGCTINFTLGTLNDTELNQLKIDYQHKTGLQLEVINVIASDGIYCNRIT